MITQSKQYHSTAVIFNDKKEKWQFKSDFETRRGRMQRGKRVEPPFLRIDDPLQTKE